MFELEQMAKKQAIEDENENLVEKKISIAFYRYVDNIETQH
jgi:hypothetical protein